MKLIIDNSTIHYMYYCIEMKKYMHKRNIQGTKNLCEAEFIIHGF